MKFLNTTAMLACMTCLLLASSAGFAQEPEGKPSATWQDAEAVEAAKQEAQQAAEEARQAEASARENDSDSRADDDDDGDSNPGNFIPTETINADSEVSFPVDI